MNSEATIPKPVRFLDGWYIQKTMNGFFRLVSASGTTTSSIVKNGEKIRKKPLLRENDFVETLNTIYRLGSPLLEYDVSS